MTTSAKVIGLETYDDRVATLSDEIPGFGGSFVDEAGRLRIMLTDEGRLDESRPKLRAFLATPERGDPEAAEWSTRVDQARSARADYDFRQLYDWKRKLATQIWSIDGVTMSDLDEVRNRVVVGVADQALEAHYRRGFGVGNPDSGGDRRAVRSAPSRFSTSTFAGDLEPEPTSSSGRRGSRIKDDDT